jgi:hypothetical protein
MSQECWETDAPLEIKNNTLVSDTDSRILKTIICDSLTVITRYRTSWACACPCVLEREVRAVA